MADSHVDLVFLVEVEFGRFGVDGLLEKGDFPGVPHQGHSALASFGVVNTDAWNKSNA